MEDPASALGLLTAADLANIKPPRLPRSSAARLRKDIRSALRGEPAAAIEALIDALDVIVARFCEFEHRETRRRPGKIQAELRKLARQIDKLQTSLGRLSEAARNEIDFEVWPGLELPESFLAAERPFIKRPLNDASPKPPPSPPRPPAPKSTCYINPASGTLARLRAAIDTRPSDENEGGAPLRRAWHDLAWRVARAVERHLCVRPSAASGHFEPLLRACLEVGLASIRSKRGVPNDLRTYTLSAIDSLKRCRSSIKPRRK
jgi:hypothetical protein